MKDRILFDGYYCAIALANLTGHIPIHRIRNWIYRHIFKIQLGEDSTIYGSCRFWMPWQIKIGEHTVLGDRLFLDGRRGITIGNNVSIGSETRIFTLEHDLESPTFGTKGGAVEIGDFVYVASRVIILPDVHIGEGAVLAAGSVVTKDVAAWAVVGGVPARFIKPRTQMRYQIKHRRAILQ